MTVILFGAHILLFHLRALDAQPLKHPPSQ